MRGPVFGLRDGFLGAVVFCGAAKVASLRISRQGQLERQRSLDDAFRAIVLPHKAPSSNLRKFTGHLAFMFP